MIHASGCHSPACLGCVEAGVDGAPISPSEVLERQEGEIRLLELNLRASREVARALALQNRELREKVRRLEITLSDRELRLRGVPAR